jgi:predicted dehydrogenase
MNVWLVGGGYWGNKIKKTVEDLGYTVSVIDIKDEKTIDDINTLDPVIIATPVTEHYAQALLLIKKGHNVYIEKPAAETVSQIQDLIANVTNQIVMVGHIFLYNPLLHELKKIIDHKVLGEIKFIHSERTNLGIYQTKVSTLMSLAPHDFSIVDHLLGSITVQDAKGFKLSDNKQYDRVSIFGKNDNTNWQIDLSWRWPIRRRIVTVIGELGQAVWDEDKKSIEIHYNQINNDHLVSTRGNEVVFNNNNQEPLSIQLEHFFDCIKYNKNPTTDLNSALDVARAIEAADAFL